MKAEQVREVEREIREVVNRGNLRSRRYVRDADAWTRFATALDTIGDTYLALQHVEVSGIPSPAGPPPWILDLGKQYLYIYGVFQAVFLQQDAIRDVWSFIVGEQLDTAALAGWQRFRDWRNRIAGHPTGRREGGVRWRTGISRISIGSAGFQIVSWNSQTRETTFETIPLSELIDKYLADAVGVLQKALGHLRATEKE